MGFRTRVQILFFFLANGHWLFPFTQRLYTGPLRRICSPGLNCFSCPAATTYCPIGALQQLLAGIRLSLETGQLHLGLYVLGAMTTMGAAVGRLICGWACPFGLLQDLLHKLPFKKRRIWPLLRYVKYGLFMVAVVVLPLVVVDASGNGQTWFCKYICPAGTLEAGIPLLFMKPELKGMLGWIFALKLFFLALVLVAAGMFSRPFCRVACPLGAFYALFNRVRLVRLSLDPSRCNQCGTCAGVCPVEIQVNHRLNDPECISCLACKNHCPNRAVGLEIMGREIGTRRIRPAGSAPNISPKLSS